MLKTSLIAAAAAFSLLVGAPAAKANDLSVTFGVSDGYTAIGGGWQDGGPRGIWDGPRVRDGITLRSPRSIVRGLYRRGFDDVEIVRVRGTTFIVSALGPQGAPVRLVVDGYTGEVTGVRVLGRPPMVDGGWGYRPSREMGW